MKKYEQIDGFSAVRGTARSRHSAPVIELQHGGRQPLVDAVRAVFEPPVKRHRFRLVWPAAAVLLVGAGAVYVRLSNRPTLDLAQPELTQMTTTAMVMGSAISPDGKYVAYATAEPRATLRLRQIKTGVDLEIIPSVPVNCCVRLSFSPDGAYIYYES